MESILKKGKGVPDEDTPDDIESTRFWVSPTQKVTDRERMTLSMESTAAVKTDSSGLGAMLASGPSGPLSLTNGDVPNCSNGSSGGPSLEALVTVLQNTAPGAPKAKAKTKPKAKPTAKGKVTLESAKTPSEHRDAMRSLDFLYI